MSISFNKSAQGQELKNPFSEIYKNQFQVPPFEAIKPEHFMPAFEQGMKEQQDEIAKICAQETAPGFENTILALEESGELLKKVASVFFNLSSANTNSEIEAISKEIAPELSRHSDDIYLNEALFKRVKIVNDRLSELGLTSEQDRLLEKAYKAFVRSGANLDADQQERMREINKELSVLTVRFGQNLLAETNSFELIADHES